METLFNTNNTEEESTRQARRLEKIERMRYEKRRQEQQRRLLKKLLPLGALVFGSIIMIVTVFAKTEPKTAVDETQVQTKQEERMVQTDATKMTGQADATEPIEQAGTTAPTGQPDTAETIEQAGTTAPTCQPDATEDIKQPNVGVTEEKTTVYNFETTADTVTIYSEEVISPNAILIDESTDKIVASKEATQRICPASMTKVLTALVAAEHITEEKLEDTFTMTTEITDYAYVNDCSSVGFVDGEKVKVRDLFYGTILPSGGDAAVGLATYVAGSHEAFVDMMNEKLKELGLSDSAHFTNCVGIYDENHYCTVYDMAIIMKAAMQNELCKEVLSAHTYTTTPTAEHPEGIIISNWFLRRIEDKDTGGEVIGAKTGYVVESKNCAVSYGVFAKGTPYICVTAGSTSSWRCIYDHVEIYKRYVKTE